MGFLAEMNGQILIYGEDETDRDVLVELIGALCVESVGRTNKRRKPILLARNGRDRELPSRARQLASAVRAEREVLGGIDCVFFHGDADALPPAATEMADAMIAAARSEDLHICAVVPGWETESWFFLFPEAIRAAFPSWRAVRSRSGSTDHIADPKRELMNATRPHSGKGGYEEKNGPAIAAKIRANGLARSPTGQSESYRRFVQCVDECCSRLKQA